MKQKLNSLIAKVNFYTVAQEWFLLTLGALLMIVSVNVFMAPAKLSPGGVTGIAIITNSFTGWSLGFVMLLFNMPMLFLGFFNLGRFRFLLKSFYVVLIYNLGVDILAPWMPPITDDLLLNALYSAVVGGVASGLIYRARGTSAGTGVLSRVLQLKTGIPLSQIYLLTDGGVILSAGLLFGWEVALYSLLTLFVWGLVTDYILEGPSVIRTAFIVTDSPEAVSQAVFERLGLGITAWVGQGMFTASQRTVLFCTLNRPEVRLLRDLVTEVDPAAFIVIGHGHQASGGVLRQVRKVAKEQPQLTELAVET